MNLVVFEIACKWLVALTFVAVLISGKLSHCKCNPRRLVATRRGEKNCNFGRRLTSGGPNFQPAWASGHRVTCVKVSRILRSVWAHWIVYASLYKATSSQEYHTVLPNYISEKKRTKIDTVYRVEHSHNAFHCVRSGHRVLFTAPRNHSPNIIVHFHPERWPV